MHIGRRQGGIVHHQGAIGNCECCETIEVPPCGAPLLEVTMSWTDGDASKPFLGQEFTNGQTRLVCPTYYNCINSPGTGTVTDRFNETWSYSELRAAQKHRVTITRVVGNSTNTSASTSVYTYTPGAGRGKAWFANAIINYKVEYPPTTPTQVLNRVLQATRRAMTYHQSKTTTVTGHRLYNLYDKDINGLWGPAAPDPVTTLLYKKIIGGAGVPFQAIAGKIGTIAGTITTSNGVTISWAKSNLGDPWGAC